MKNLLPLLLVLSIGRIAHAENSPSQVLMDFETVGTGNEFLKWPYPSEHVRVGSTIAFFPHSVDCAGQMGMYTDLTRSMLQRPPAEQGFGLTSAIYFPTHHAVNPASLPTPNPLRNGPPQDPHPGLGMNIFGLPVGDATQAGFAPPSVYLMGVQAGSPDFGHLYPIITGNKDAANGIATGPINIGGGMYSETGNSCGIPPTCICASIDAFTTDNCHCQDDVIVLAPYQGVSLRPNTLYAAVITNQVLDGSGMPLHAPDALTGMLSTFHTTQSCTGPEGHGMPPGAACTSYMTALNAIASLPSGSSLISSMVGLSVFRTGDPTAALRNAVNDAATNHPPVVSSLSIDSADYPASLTPTHVAGVYPDYCVYSGTVSLPNYQTGTRPFPTSNSVAEESCVPGDIGCYLFNAFDPRSYVRNGGMWSYAPGSNTPIFQNMDNKARIWVTIPRKPKPAAGYPVAVFVRYGSGGDRPLMDRRAETGSHGYLDPAGSGSCGSSLFAWNACEVTPPDRPGEGPAQELARAGFAGLMIDDPLSAVRNNNAWSTNSEDDKIFNALNLSAMRDNLRESALELALMPEMINSTAIPVDGSSCPATVTCDDVSTGCTPVSSGFINHPFDSSTIALIGHSVGAQVAPIAFAVQPKYGLSILGGHNGSYISNIIYKVDPQPGAQLAAHNINTMRDLAEMGAVLRTAVDGEGSAAVNMAQNLLEAGDSPVYNANLTAPRMIRSASNTPPTQYMLSIQGVIDHYIEPPIRNAADFTAGLSLAVQTPSFTSPFGALDTAAVYNDVTVAHGPRDDAGTLYPLGVDAHGFRPLTSDIDLSGFTAPVPGIPGRQVIGLPVQAISWSFTTQHTSDGIEDGHEVMFQLAEPKHQYKCFLRSWYLNQQMPAAAPADRGPMIPQALNADGDMNNCWDHKPNEVGNPLINTSDCCVDIVCQAHPDCCKTVWDSTCVAAYESTYPTCNLNPLCQYLGASDIMTPSARSDTASYMP